MDSPPYDGSEIKMSTERKLYMKFPFLASFIIFLFWLTYELYKHKNDQAKIDNAFWKREKQAEKSFARDLDSLDYISIPLHLFPYDLFPDHEKLQEDKEMLLALTRLRIMNFSTLSNTELKLRYGAANIDALSEYDHNFTLLCRLISNLSKALTEAGYDAEAMGLLEFAVSIQIDISNCYYLLGNLYKKHGQLDKIEEMIEKVSSLNSILSKTIEKNLRKLSQSDDLLHS